MEVLLAAYFAIATFVYCAILLAAIGDVITEEDRPHKTLRIIALAIALTPVALIWPVYVWSLYMDTR